MHINDATKHIAQIVGISFCANKYGFDDEVVRLAAIVGFRRDDICRSSNLVAQSISEYLEDLVRNP